MDQLVRDSEIDAMRRDVENALHGVDGQEVPWQAQAGPLGRQPGAEGRS